jgi:hypothetical protein
VLNPVLQRAVRLILVLALLAGAQTRVMPMAMPAVDSSMAGMPAGGSDACKGCAPGKMIVQDCDAICATVVAVLDDPREISRVALPALWAWSNDPLRRYSLTPDTGPPRS